MDFTDGRWPAYRFVDGYLVTVTLILGVSLFRWLSCISPEHRYMLAFIVAVIVAFIQFIRLWIVLTDRRNANKHADPFSIVYYYSYILAHRRGIPAVSVKETEGTGTPKASTDIAEPPHDDDEEDTEEGKTTSSTDLWRQEFMDTYRHLREHGNSAFIFLLELVLAALAFCVVAKPGQSPANQLSAIGLLFAIWALPSVFVHLLAQHLERRFSRYDLKVRSTTKSKEAE